MAAGLAAVIRIQSVPEPTAHGGLDFVPAEQSFLLSRGERVLSPRQNRDLTEFLKVQVGEGGGGPMVGTMNVYALNAGDAAGKIGRALGRQAALGRLTR